MSALGVRTGRLQVFAALGNGASLQLRKMEQGGMTTAADTCSATKPASQQVIPSFKLFKWSQSPTELAGKGGDPASRNSARATWSDSRGCMRTKSG